MLLLAIFAFSIPKVADAAKEVRVSAIEVNHRMDGEIHCFSQVILWQWDAIYARHDVVAWWLMDRHEYAPRRSGGVWHVEREIKGREFRFRSGVKFETWTQHDPERENQSLRAERYRLKLGDLPELERFIETHSSEN